MKRNYLVTILLSVIMAILVIGSWIVSPATFTRHIQHETVSLNSFIKKIEREPSSIESIHITKENIGLIHVRGRGIILRSGLPVNHVDIINMILANNIEVFVHSSGRASFWQFIIVHLASSGAEIIGHIIIVRYLLRRDDDESDENNEKEVRRIKFKDIVGMEEEKEKLKEAYEFMIHSDKYKGMGFNMQNGVIMSGPPGNGKTYLARALAGEFKAHFIATTAAEWISLYVGTGPKAIREIYEEARKNQPCIVFIDEIDAIGQRSSNASGGDKEYNATINQLLVELDGAKVNKHVLTICATNRIDTVDHAILRSGRIGTQIYVDNPSPSQRKKLIEATLNKFHLMSTISVNDLSKSTARESRADIVHIIESACKLALKEAILHKKIAVEDAVVTGEHVDDVLMDMWVGPKTEMQWSDRQVTETCYHETGHAFIHYYFRNVLGRMMKLITVESRGNTLGCVVSHLDEEEIPDNYKIPAKICINLAGNLAEKVFCNKVSIGCSSDLQTVRGLAEQYLMFGLDEDRGLQYIPVHSPNNGYDSMMSEKEKSVIYDKVTELVKRLTSETTKILEDNKDKIHAFVKILKEKKTIRADELYKMFDGLSSSTELVSMNFRPLLK